jgi:hypothetical protein
MPEVQTPGLPPPREWKNNTRAGQADEPIGPPLKQTVIEPIEE